MARTRAVKTFMQVVELDDDQLLLVGVLNRKQLTETYKLFEPLSRAWRGQYQILAKAIVEAHGGTIAVTSQLGHGSVFSFSLPASA